MALSVSVSRAELARAANLAYEGETLAVMLCNVGGSGYGPENTVAEWQTLEVSGNGYVRFTGPILTGAFDAVDGRHEMPAISAEFTASGAGYSYDRVVLYVVGVTNVHSVFAESPPITLLSGATQGYLIELATDD